MGSEAGPEFRRREGDGSVFLLLEIQSAGLGWHPMITFRRIALVSLLLGAGSCSPAQPAEVELPGDSFWKDARLFDRILVIGASASAGFGQNQDLGVVTAAALGQKSSDVMNLASGGFFARPLRNGQRVMERAVEYDPTLVIAIDFPFWFAYGRRRDSQRSEFLAQGLELLNSLDCPIILGGIPDMTDAIGLMLTRSLVPAVEVQAELDSQVRTWANDRPLVRFYDIRTSEKKTRAGSTELLGQPWPPEGAPLLQPDRLHPTLVGLVGILLDAFHAAGIADRVKLTPLEVLAAATPMRRSR